jgi:hypothetical protein
MDIKTALFLRVLTLGMVKALKKPKQHNKPNSEVGAWGNWKGVLSHMYTQYSSRSIVITIKHKDRYKSMAAMSFYIKKN